MIRHASTSPAKPVLSLPHAVSPSAKFSPLVAAIGRTALSPSSYLSARLGAMALARSQWLQTQKTAPQARQWRIRRTTSDMTIPRLQSTYTRRPDDARLRRG